MTAVVTTAGLRTTLVELRRRVDVHFTAAAERSPTDLTCRPGCTACCHVRIGVFTVEAAPIAQALAELAVDDPQLRARIRDQANDPAHADHCALLVDGRCAVYAQRPLICRSHGLPVALRDPDAPPETPLRLDHCPLNFTANPPPRASILNLEAVNHPLAVLASLWTEATAGRSPSPSERIDLADLARAPDPPEML